MGGGNTSIITGCILTPSVVAACRLGVMSGLLHITHGSMDMGFEVIRNLMCKQKF